eukprot:CAMPEP_0172177198 /NCGR_PEP_ID=MMETSP1050-20130122/15292_1 /TAXON_ID=233186 /ORGANISM="Cryptomonas curvata, Strain CCAP979/52" /LENGTH=477 /DNA_ID=CAMNT_0012849669 /DNA_START=36 /DNA_END=1470 /DNA_ORIENTATION=-
MVWKLIAALGLVFMHAVRHSQASQQDSVVDIRYCIEHKLNTITCKIDSPQNVSTRSRHSIQVPLNQKRVLDASSVWFGIHHDVPISSLGSFAVCMDQPYSHIISPEELMACATDPDQMVVVGSKSSASASTLSVMAVARAADAFRETDSLYSAYYANGAYWYNVALQSFGFSDEPYINLNSADISCSSILGCNLGGGGGDGGDGGDGGYSDCGPCSCENKLSWHMGFGGWRSGCTEFLTDNTVWRKVVYKLGGSGFCPLGSYCSSGASDSNLPCPVGTYCNESSLTAPKPCDRGAYCPTTGMTSPTPCPAGSICPDTGMSAPMPCSPGSFCPTIGLTTQHRAQQGHTHPRQGRARATSAGRARPVDSAPDAGGGTRGRASSVADAPPGTFGPVAAGCRPGIASSARLAQRASTSQGVVAALLAPACSADRAPPARRCRAAAERRRALASRHPDSEAAAVLRFGRGGGGKGLRSLITT